MACCCQKAEASSLRKYKKRKDIVINGRWRMGKAIGKGGYGKVYEAFDIEDSCKMFAMKTEELRYPDENGRLPQEALVIETLMENNVDRHIARLLDKGRIEEEKCRPIQFIVMTMLGPSLAILRKLCPKHMFTATTVANIAIQALEAIEPLHLLGFIHRDIKPGNFMLGLGEHKHEVFLIDFGMARYILDEHGKLKPRRNNPVPFRGTVRYCAPTTHAGMEYGRHDDLWCLFNTLAELRKGELPWESLEHNRKATFEIKHKIVPERWLNDIEPEFLLLYENLTTLHYDMTPDYPLCRWIFERILENESATMLSPLDWEDGGTYQKKIKRKTMTKLFREEERST